MKKFKIIRTTSEEGVTADHGTYDTEMQARVALAVDCKAQQGLIISENEFHCENGKYSIQEYDEPEVVNESTV